MLEQQAAAHRLIREMQAYPGGEAGAMADFSAQQMLAKREPPSAAPASAVPAPMAPPAPAGLATTKTPRAKKPRLMEDYVVGGSEEEEEPQARQAVQRRVPRRAPPPAPFAPPPFAAPPFAPPARAWRAPPASLEPPRPGNGRETESDEDDSPRPAAELDDDALFASAMDAYGLLAPAGDGGARLELDLLDFPFDLRPEASGPTEFESGFDSALDDPLWQGAFDGPSAGPNAAQRRRKKHKAVREPAAFNAYVAPKPRAKPHNPWSVEEAEALVQGVAREGAGRWTEIKRIGYAVLAGRSAVDLKARFFPLTPVMPRLSLILARRTSGATWPSS